ncbi:MAG: patatin-like phospholipase family protein [Gemmatimonadales bacterium]|nr:patatin-like phospholipase family protein [Gemmatimonadales bacterium]
MRGERAVLVLSGGGAKAAAHIGASQAVAEAGLRVTAYVGTSMGAVIGAAFAGGRTADEILDDVGRLRRRDIAAINPAALLAGFRARSLLREGPLRRTLQRLVPIRRFNECRVPLTVAATDLDSREQVWLGAGGLDVPLLDALYASTALPLYYPPAIIEGRRYADGGLRAVLPLEGALEIEADLVVAVDVGPGFDEPLASAKRGVPRLVQAYNEANSILMASNTQAQVALWDCQAGTDTGLARLIYIRPQVERGATFQVKRAQAYAEEGYRAASAALQDAG